MNRTRRAREVRTSPQRPVAFCQHCGKPLDHETKRVVGAAVYCEPCLRRGSRRSLGRSLPAGQGGGYGRSICSGEQRCGEFRFRQGEPNPGLAALLGLIPGVGAMYNEQYAKGIVHLVIFAVLVSFSHVSGIFIIFIFGWLAYMSIEAHHTAKARRDGTPLPNPFGFNDIGERMGFGKAWPGAAGCGLRWRATRHRQQRQGFGSIHTGFAPGLRFQPGDRNGSHRLRRTAAGATAGRGSGLGFPSADAYPPPAAREQVLHTAVWLMRSHQLRANLRAGVWSRLNRIQYGTHVSPYGAPFRASGRALLQPLLPCPLLPGAESVSRRRHLVDRGSEPSFCWGRPGIFRHVSARNLRRIAADRILAIWLFFRLMTDTGLRASAMTERLVTDCDCCAR